MTTDIHDVEITHDRDHLVVYVNGEFFCTADTYSEAVKEVYEAYK